MTRSFPKLSPAPSADSLENITDVAPRIVHNQSSESIESVPRPPLTSASSRAQVNALIKQHNVSRTQFKKIRALFDDIALEENCITISDLERALREVGLDEDTTPEDVERMLLAYDLNGDKKLQFSEFLTMVLETGIMNSLEEESDFSEICEHLFNFFDQNKDSRLSVSEIQAKIYEITRTFLEKAEIEKNLKDLIGLEEGGAVSYNDFVLILQNSRRTV